MSQQADSVSVAAMGEHRSLSKITDAVWPNACPSKYEDQVLSIICGNTHLQWALHVGIGGKFIPQLFWRTPALTADEIDAGDPCGVLERYLPPGGQELIFGSQTVPADKVNAIKASSARRMPLLSVYVVSTNPNNELGVEFLFRDIPCRMYRLTGDDFFSAEEGAYPGMGVDRLANVKAASTFYNYPLMVIDGGTAMTYTAADANGKLVGGGIFPGLNCMYRSLHDYTGELPLISQEEINKLIGDAIAGKKPISMFATDTKSAMITTGIKAMAEICWGAVSEFKKQLMEGAEPTVTEGESMEVEGENGDKRYFTICLTGGDGDVIARLLEVDHNGVLHSNVPADSRVGVDVQKHKHLSHYGIGHVLHEKTIAGQNLKSGDDKIREDILGQRVAKMFKIRADEKIYRGTVAAIANGDKLDKDWYYVRYDDGDTEHLTNTDLYEGLILYRDVGEADPDEAATEKCKKKVAQAEDTAKLLIQVSAEVKKYSEMPAAQRSAEKKGKKRSASVGLSKPAPAAKAARGGKGAKKENPTSHVGKRVSKYFGDELYFGTVKKYIEPKSKKEEDLWHIVYDDDDQEDYDAKDLRKGFALYRSKQSEDKVSRVTAVAGVGADEGQAAENEMETGETEPAAEEAVEEALPAEEMPVLEETATGEEAPPAP